VGFDYNMWQQMPALAPVRQQRDEQKWSSRWRVKVFGRLQRHLACIGGSRVLSFCERFFCESSFICADGGGQAAVIIYAVAHDVRGDGVVGSTTTIIIGVVWCVMEWQYLCRQDLFRHDFSTG
jgi:hypothetical protein